MAINFAEWDKSLEDPSSNKQELYDQLVKEQESNPNNENLCRLSKAAIILCNAAAKNKDKENDKKWSFAALEYGKKAIEFDKSNVESHKWYCAAIGRASRFLGVKEKLQLAHEFKKHSDIAIEIQPDNELLHHMYGRWCFEVAGLSWMEKKIAATFFGTPPESSYNEALSSLTRAYELKPNWKENLLWMAKVNIKFSCTINIKFNCTINIKFNCTINITLYFTISDFDRFEKI